MTSCASVQRSGYLVSPRACIVPEDQSVYAVRAMESITSAERHCDVPRASHRLTLPPDPGLINNVLYVIILSAALDLVGPSIPKGVVLLADVLPSFLVKLTAPYYIHIFPYSVRVIVFVLLSAGGMLVIALSPETRDGPTVSLKLLGVALASLSSGGGELSFLGLTHFYGRASLASWSSGTGGAGLIGAGAYVLTTTSLGLSSRASLLAFSFLPVIMLLSFFVVLPSRDMGKGGSAVGATGAYATLPTEEEPVLSQDDDEDDAEREDLDRSPKRLTRAATPASQRVCQQFRFNLRRARGLFIP